MASQTRPKAGGAHGVTGADASFMRIEVASVLKLVLLSSFATFALAIIVAIGYVGAPTVSLSDFTSNPVRCTSDFSLELFHECETAAASADDNTTTSLPSTASSTADTSGSVAAIDALLQLSPTAQEPVLSCMFDACTNTSKQPVAVTESSLDVAHYSFELNGFEHRNRYFYLQVAFPNQHRSDDHTFNVTMTPHVKGLYTNATSGARASALLITDVRQQTLMVACRRGASYCDENYFLRFNEIDYHDYRVDVLFNASDSLPLVGADVQFKKTWGAKAFTNWLIGVKLFFLFVSAAVAVWYHVSLSHLAAREQSLEQGWVATLVVTLVLFNDPFYVAEAHFGGNPVKILGVLFHVTFYQLLLLFWLVQIDNIRLHGNVSGVSNTQFFAPKITYIGIFWLLNAVYHGYMKYYANNDPTWDPLALNANFALVQALSGALCVFYVLWIIYLVIVSNDAIRARRMRYRYLVMTTFAMVLLAFVGLDSGAMSPAPASGGDWTAFHALFNIYVFVIAYLYAPSPAAIRAAKKRRARTLDTDVDAEAEAAPVLSSDDEAVQTAAIDVEDVATSELDDSNIV